MNRWVGKVAIVTGASAGIGAAIAVSLAQAGLIVIGVARREERVKELQEKLAGASGALHPYKADISDEQQIKELFAWAKKKFTTVHVLVNNAGITRGGKVVEQNPKHWRDIFATNVIGLAIASQEAVKLMRETGVDDGQIILINSVLGHIVPNMPDPMLGVYPASKYAVTALTETIRQELRALKTNIRVTSLSPGVVRTEFGDAANAALEAHERIDLSHFANMTKLESEDLAQAVLYILSTPPRVQVHELILKPIGSMA